MQMYVNTSAVVCAGFMLNKQVVERDVLQNAMWKITNTNPDELPTQTLLICIKNNHWHV